MTTLRVILTLSAAAALAALVAATELGRLPLPTEQGVLAALEARNPGLRDSGVAEHLRAFPIYPDGRALIHVAPNAEGYTGALEVYFNGGRPAARSAADVVNLADTRLSLVALPRRASEAQILAAYVAQVGPLPRTLRGQLRAQQVARGRATVEAGSPRGRYQGRATVTW